MKNVAVIDCGSNSFRMLIAQLDINKFNIIRREYDMVMLGRKLSSKEGIIEAKTIEDSLDVLRRYRKIMSDYNCKKYFCIGTSVFRTAKNADELIHYVKINAGIEINVISEKKEAQYSFLGALGDAREKDNYVVVDIGGGSTEIVYYKDHQLQSHSLLLGAARLKGIFWDEKLTPNTQEVVDANHYIRDLIKKESINISKDCLIGVAGTITSLVSIDKKLEQYKPDAINNTILSLKKIKSMLLYIMRLDERERFNLPGMFPTQRANNIIAGLMILVAVMEEFGFSKITVKSTCILEGIILENFLQ